MRARRYKPRRRRTKIKRKKSQLKKLLGSRVVWFAAFGLFGICAVAYGVFFTPLFHIRHIEVSGVQEISAQEISQIAGAHMRHLLLADAEGAVREIRSSFPEAETISVARVFPNRVKIAVKERTEKAVWCPPSPPCFALDGNGVVFKEQEANERLVIQEGGAPEAVLGERVIDPELLSAMLNFQRAVDASRALQEAGLRVSSFSVVSRERVNAAISEGWQIYMNPEEDIEWQITKAKLVLEQEVPFEKLPLLDYIDIRFGDQAYIKYR